MISSKFVATFALGSIALLTFGAGVATAQSHVNSPDPALGAPSVNTEESHIGNLTGHAAGREASLPPLLHRLSRAGWRRQRDERAVDRSQTPGFHRSYL